MKKRTVTASKTSSILSRRNTLLLQRRSHAGRTIRRLTTILRRKYGATRIILVGSCANPEQFDFHSDIDLAVQGIAPDQFFKAAGEMLLSAEGFDVDLVPIESANARMLAAVKSGEVLYEKRKSAA